MRTLSNAQRQEAKVLPLRPVNDLNATAQLKARLKFTTNEGTVLLPYDDVAYIQSDGNYSYVVTVEEKRTLVSKSLKSLTAQLDEEVFFRIHNQYTLNLNELREIHTDCVILANGVELPIARRRKKELMDMMIKL